MKNPAKLKSVILKMTFIMYIIILLYLVFFRFAHGYFRDLVNLIPFKTILGYLSEGLGTSPSVSLGNVLGNIVMFIPLGVYLKIFLKDKRWFVSFLWIFISTVAIELIQFILKIGVCDIDDVILNSIGGLTGILIYRILALLVKDESKLNTVISIFASLVGLPVLIIMILLIAVNSL